MKRIIKRVGKKELAYVREALAGDFCSTAGGKMLNRLERAFAARIGSQFAIGHINGTATLHSALYAAGVGPGDEVIVPPLTMSSTALAVLQQDAAPVFADVRADTFLIDPASIAKRITSRTKAIITVALYGLSPAMDAIMKIARRHKLLVIEDDAQCFLGKYKGRMAGTIGHLASFSFQSSKQITAGEGGMVCTNDAVLAERVRKFSVLGYAAVSARQGKISKDDIQNPNYNRHVCLGYNYRMPELAAAVLLGQLEHADELAQRRIDAANLFLEALGDCQWLRPQAAPPDCKNVYWSLGIRLLHPKLSWFDFRKKFMSLGGDGIYAAWKLTYLEPMFQKLDFAGKEQFIKPRQKYAPGLCPTAEQIQPQILAFKTNYWDWRDAERQAAILSKTIKFYDRK